MFGWTDLTYLLNKANVSWAYYSAPDSENLDDPDEGVSLSQFQVLNHFVTVQQDGQMGNLKDNNQFFTDVAAGALPAVTWVMPSYANSEHPLSSVSDGQAWITRCVNALMQSPDWNSTAIFITYDEWGGFYDHVAPPAVDANGYGLRIPGLVISPYAKQGYIDHQQLSFDAYVKFI